jgi:hypothetical protein
MLAAGITIGEQLIPEFRAVARKPQELDRPADGNGEPVEQTPALPRSWQKGELFMRLPYNALPDEGKLFVTGRYLAHNHLPFVRRAFTGADLVNGRTQLVSPTIKGAASLVRVSPAAVQAALQQEANRTAIEVGVLSLFPSQRPALPAPSARERVIALVDDIGWNAILNTLLSVGVPVDAANDNGNGAVVDTGLN